MALSDLQKMVVGMFSPGQTPANASIYDLARADAQRQAIAQLGMGLVGAAVPQTPIMRAQALQQALSSVGNIGTNTYNSAQARLMAQRAEADIARQKASEAFYGQKITPTIVPAPEPVGEFREIPSAARRLITPPPPTVKVSFPGGLTEGQWSSVQALADKKDFEAADQLLASFVAKNAEDSGFEGSKTLIGVVDENGKYFNTYLDIDGNPRRPKGAVGELKQLNPYDVAKQKSAGNVEGKSESEAKTGAPAAINAADKTINLIDSILESPSLDAVVGDFQGRFDDPTIIRSIGGNGAVLTVNRIRQLKAKGFIQAINTTDLKGALSDAEGLKLDDAENALNRVLDEESFRKELMTYRDIIVRAKQRQALIESGKTEAEARQIVPESPLLSGVQESPQNSPVSQQPNPSISTDSNDPLGIR